MAIKIQVRRGSTGEWGTANPILMEGELGADLTLHKFKVGDGTSLWSGLPFEVGQDGSHGTSGTSSDGSHGTSGTSGTSSDGSHGTSGTSGTSSDGSHGTSGTSGTSSDGSHGTSGTSGTSSDGSHGTSGTSGTSSDGSHGTSGTSGTSSDGSHGTSGTSGTSSDGSHGTSGTSGTDGSSGSSGTSGSAGSHGTSGTSGTSSDGSHGTSGTSGSAGSHGTSGTSGTSGSSGSSQDTLNFVVDIGRFGFSGTPETSIGFDGTDTFTLTVLSGTWTYYRSGAKHTITGNKSKVLATPMVDNTLYYIFIDGTDGELSSATSGWTLNDTKVPVATVYWQSALTPKFIMADERHTCLVDRRWHREHHFVEGVQVASGGTIGATTLNSTTPASKVFSIAETQIFDEDLTFTVAGLTKPDGATAVYYNLYRTSVTVGAVLAKWDWVASDMPFKYAVLSGTPTYDEAEYDLDGTSTPASNNNYINTYLLICNSVNNTETFPNSTADTRFLIVQGRVNAATTTAAYAESFGSLDMSGLPVTEAVAVYQFTWRCNGANTVKGRCTLNRVQRISTNIVQTTTTTIADHNSMGGLQGGAIGEYFHMTDVQHGWMGSASTGGGGYTSGTSGTSGSAGSHGTSGTSGTSGSAGSHGTSGSSGTSGADGSTGSSGSSGSAGSHGTSGTSGSSGTSSTAAGTNGTSGTSGSSGTSPTSGAAGTSSKSFMITSPTTDSDSPVWRTPVAITISAVHVLCIGTGTCGIVGQIDDYDISGANPAPIAADMTGTSGTTVTGGTAGTRTIAAGRYVGWRTVSVGGTVTRAIVTYDYVNA